MIVTATATGLGEFTAFQKQKTTKLQGYSLLEIAGSRYPVNVTLTDQQFDILYNQLASGQSVQVSLELWAKVYVNQDGEHKASINTKLLSIG